MYQIVDLWRRKWACRTAPKEKKVTFCCQLEKRVKTAIDCQMKYAGFLESEAITFNGGGEQWSI
jgi:hypothetical protein